MTNTTKVTNTKEDHQIWTASTVNPKEDNLTWTCKAVSSLITLEQGITTLVKTKEVATSIGQEKGLLVDLIVQEIEPQAETEKLPGRRVTNQTITGTMTLAMEDIIEDTARRPCIMGGHL